MTARSYDYDTKAMTYDALELDTEGVTKVNLFLKRIFQKNKAKKILDLTCGTGAQAIYLSNYFNVTAADLSRGMLSVAKKKVKTKKLHIRFKQGDMRHKIYGKFDGIITMFNAIGHLTKPEFEKTLRNVHRQLNNNGLFAFDIFNMDFMRKHFVNDFIDTAKTEGDKILVRINHNTLDRKNGIMHLNQHIYFQEHFRLREEKDSWDMQIYSLKEAEKMLNKNGFKLVSVRGPGAGTFKGDGSISFLLVARKVHQS